MPTATAEPTTAADAIARLAALEADMIALTPALVPERLAGHLVGRTVRSLGRIERCAAGARLVLAKAAAESGAWKAAGCRSPQEWAAKENGTTVGEAKADLEASAQLANLPAARDAAATGRLSPAAAKAVAAGASADPSSEQALVDKGAAGDLAGVRDEARRARQRRDERDGKAAQRMYERRALRTWVEVDGEGRGQWNVPPAYQAVFLAALEPYRREAFKQAHASGQRPSHEALMADALQMLCLDVLADLDLDLPGGVPADQGQPQQGATQQGAAPTDRDAPNDEAAADPPTVPQGDQFDFGEPAPAPPPTTETEPSETSSDPHPPVAADDTSTFSGNGDTGPSPLPPPRRPRGGNRRAPAQVIVHVDLEALMRGHALDGETCEVHGLGPVPVSLARQLAEDSILKILLTGATNVTTITSHRRYIPAALRAAVLARDRTCVVPGCAATHNLEIDHTTDFAKRGPTELGNLGPLCYHHHHLKTHCRWILRGPPGQWTFEPP